jgi:cytochrome c
MNEPLCRKAVVSAHLMAGATTLALALTSPALAAGPVAGDPAAGKGLFAARCGMCHGAEGQGQAMGPRLRGVFGVRAASQSNQKYSAALKAARIPWTAANLDSFLKAPQAAVPGTTMMVSVPNVRDRQNLIAYLAALPK